MPTRRSSQIWISFTPGSTRFFDASILLPSHPNIPTTASDNLLCPLGPHSLICLSYFSVLLLAVLSYIQFIRYDQFWYFGVISIKVFLKILLIEVSIRPMKRPTTSQSTEEDFILAPILQLLQSVHRKILSKIDHKPVQRELTPFQKNLLVLCQQENVSIHSQQARTHMHEASAYLHEIVSGLLKIDFCIESLEQKKITFTSNIFKSLMSCVNLMLRKYKNVHYITTNYYNMNQQLMNALNQMDGALRFMLSSINQVFLENSKTNYNSNICVSNFAQIKLNKQTKENQQRESRKNETICPEYLDYINQQKQLLSFQQYSSMEEGNQQWLSRLAEENSQLMAQSRRQKNEPLLQNSERTMVLPDKETIFSAFQMQLANQRRKISEFENKNRQLQAENQVILEQLNKLMGETSRLLEKVKIYQSGPRCQRCIEAEGTIERLERELQRLSQERDYQMSLVKHLQQSYQYYHHQLSDRPSSKCSYFEPLGLGSRQFKQQRQIYDQYAQPQNENPLNYEVENRYRLWKDYMLPQYRQKRVVTPKSKGHFLSCKDLGANGGKVSSIKQLSRYHRQPEYSHRVRNRASTQIHNLPSLRVSELNKIGIPVEKQSQEKQHVYTQPSEAPKKELLKKFKQRRQELKSQEPQRIPNTNSMSFKKGDQYYFDSLNEKAEKKLQIDSNK